MAFEIQMALDVSTDAAVDGPQNFNVASVLGVVERGQRRERCGSERGIEGNDMAARGSQMTRLHRLRDRDWRS